MSFHVDHLTYSLNGRSLIENISLKFAPGILYGILGPNGSGKSTLLKTMARIWKPTKGRLLWQEKDLFQYSRTALSRIVSWVSQNPQLYFDLNVYSMVALGRYPHGCRSSEAQENVSEALQKVNAWHLRDQLISQLSGGERQRVYIARALATQAPILLLDEPTSYLDLRHQLEIWHLLRMLVKEGKLVIVAVHDLLAAQRFCDQLVILHQGRCQTTGSYEEVITPQLLQNIFGVEINGHKNFELINPCP